MSTRANFRNRNFVRRERRIVRDAVQIAQTGIGSANQELANTNFAETGTLLGYRISLAVNGNTFGGSAIRFALWVVRKGVDPTGFSPAVDTDLENADLIGEWVTHVTAGHNGGAVDRVGIVNWVLNENVRARRKVQSGVRLVLRSIRVTGVGSYNVVGTLTSFTSV